MENEWFLDDQDRGVTDDEDFEDQEDMEGHGGDETNKGAVAWQVLLPRKSRWCWKYVW